jgi:hypothetical protein
VTVRVLLEMSERVPGGGLDAFLDRAHRHLEVAIEETFELPFESIPDSHFFANRSQTAIFL